MSEQVLELRVALPGESEERFQLSCDTEIWVGRDGSCHVVLPSPAVSRRHVSLAWRDGEIVVRDCSSNGTRVAGTVLSRDCRLVGPQVRMGVGPYELRVSGPAPSVQKPPGPQAMKSPPTEGAAAPREPRVARSSLRRRLRDQLIEQLDLVSLEREKMEPEVLRPRVQAALEEIVGGCDQVEVGDRAELVQALCDEAVGLGPLEPLLADPAVSEVMVVDPETIYAERAGVLALTTTTFTDATAVRSAIERIVTPLGRRIDESSPLVDARLADGSRVHAVIPPLALKGPCITIRKFPTQRLDMDDLVRFGSLSRQMATFLSRAVQVRCNVLISGGTGSGKTTLLNVLSASIPERERVVTIEDAAELHLAQRHVVTLEARPANMEGVGAVTIRDLVKNALRMRPDRIVVGECRGGEALDMLQAMNTGHDGSMTTTHANSPPEAVQRLETLCLMSGIELPASAIRRQVASSIDLIVQQSRSGDGSRRVTSITEVVGLADDGHVQLREIFRFDPCGDVDGPATGGAYRLTGHVPDCLERFCRAGLVTQGDWL